MKSIQLDLYRPHLSQGLPNLSYLRHFLRLPIEICLSTWLLSQQQTNRPRSPGLNLQWYMHQTSRMQSRTFQTSFNQTKSQCTYFLYPSVWGILMARLFSSLQILMWKESANYCSSHKACKISFHLKKNKCKDKTEWGWDPGALNTSQKTSIFCFTH